MPEPATPPNVPVTPPAPPIPASQRDPLAPQDFVHQNPEDDADHQLKQMISRRRKPATPEPDPAAAAPPAPATPPPPKPADPAPEPEPEPKPSGGFNDAIANVLQFKPKKKAPVKPTDAAPPADAPPAPAAADPATPPAEPAKTIVKKKAPAPVVPDISQITAAATTAAVQALRGQPKDDAPPTRKPEDDLKPDDRHDYEVAKTLAELNPRYKDAPKVILDQVKKSEAYATRWETANPGKQFDPNDEEHSDFYDSIQTPWSTHEFEDAKIEMVAARRNRQHTEQTDAKFRKLEQDNARLELTPVAEKAFSRAATYMAKELGVSDKIADFDKFYEEDPITAGAMANALGPVRPLLEAIVQIDDPRGRFEIDPNNEAHQAWIQLLGEKEAQYSGVESSDGKMFATRVAYVAMTPAQRARHWHLSADHLATEVVNDAISAAKEVAKNEKERQKKIARSLGFVPAEELKTPPKTSVATNGDAGGKPPEPAPAAAKPVSPTVGSGAKIDAVSAPDVKGRAATLSAMGNILFRPGNTVT